MPRAARLPAAVAGLLLLAFLWVAGVDIALRFPDSYVLPDRTRNVGVVVGWSAVLAALVAVARRRGRLASRRWHLLTVALLVSNAAVLGWLVRVDAQDYPRVTFGFVAGAGLDRLFVLLALGLVVPTALAGAALAALQHFRVRQQPLEVPAPSSPPRGVRWPTGAGSWGRPLAECHQDQAESDLR